MARPRKVPAVLVEATIRENGKLAALPSDTARLGYFYVCLGAAKLLKPTPGLFTGKLHFREVAGRFAKYLEAYLAGGLLEESPRLCDRCKDRWSKTPPNRGQIVVHDWHEHQYDPNALERQRAYDERQRAAQAEAGEGPQSDAVSDAVSYAQSDAVSGEFPMGDSRDRGRRRAANVERRTENYESGTPTLGVNARNGRVTRQVKGFAKAGDVADALAEQSSNWTQALTLAERDEWSTFGSEWDAFRAAWLERGFRHPPAGTAEDDPDATNPSQRALLYSVLDAWPNELPVWISEAPRKLSASQVVAHVIDRWHSKRDEGAERDRQQEAAAKTAKGESVPSWMKS